MPLAGSEVTKPVLDSWSTRIKGVFDVNRPRSPLLLSIFSGAVLAAFGFIAFANPNRIHRWAVFLAAFLLYPGAQMIFDSAAPKWRPAYTLMSLTAVCAALGIFIKAFGNHQFAGYDCSLLVDVGWRLIQGQIPYRDFICTLPPGFILGVKYAYQLFGVQWDAILYMEAIFASISFLWIFGLLSGSLRHRLAAFLVALSIECAGVLPISYWWHNSIASVTAAIFLLSCLRYLNTPNRLSTQASYVAALMLFGLMKPNTVLPLVAGAVLLLFWATPAIIRFTLLTALSAGGMLLILVLNHISPIGLALSYRAVAAARGLSTLGFDILKPVDRLRASIYIFLLLVPGCLSWWSSFRSVVRSRDRRSLSGHLLLLLSAAVGIFAMLTNCEMKDTDFPLLICFSAVLLWGRQYALETGRGEPESCRGPVKLKSRTSTPRMRRMVSIVASTSATRVYACFLCGLAISEIYLGVARQRIEMAEHEFFERADNDHRPGVPYFRDMRSSRHLNRVLTQAAEVVRESPGPVFFGSRLEFIYAALGVASPHHVPIWWDPGTSYKLTDESSILEAWRRNGFATLVYFPHMVGPPFVLQVIREMYVQDDRWPDLIVFHAKPVGPREGGKAGLGGDSTARILPNLSDAPTGFCYPYFLRSFRCPNQSRPVGLGTFADHASCLDLMLLSPIVVQQQIRQFAFYCAVRG